MPAPDVLLTLLVNARNEQPDPTALARQVGIVAGYCPPTHEAVVEAIGLGSAQVLDALLQSPTLTDDARRLMATRGLLAWNENPMQHRTSARLLRVLMQHGANANLRILPHGETVTERLGVRIGTLEGNEARAFERGKIKQPSIAGQILMECWAIMEEAGMDMAEARRLRNMAMEPAGIVISRPRRGEPDPEDPVPGLRVA